MRYPKKCECGLEVAHLDKHRHGMTHKTRVKLMKWYNMIQPEHYTINQYKFQMTHKALKEIKEYLGLSNA